MNSPVDKLEAEKSLSDAEFKELLETDAYDKALFQAADRVRRKAFGIDVYLRGLIEISNYCRNNCYYCGIRRDNHDVTRYRLTPDEIIACCENGHELGFRTFVFQGGEDSFYSDSILCDIISSVKSSFPDSAITLSLGEKPRSGYEAFFKAGADRYLLRHETAGETHYKKLHPESMSLENRKKCLFNLKDIGFQVGSGFMVGSPFQTTGDIIQDLRFFEDLIPHMIGIGPFLSHKNTPFKDYPNGDIRLCLRLIAVLRLMFPKALLPSTTALGTIAADGRERGLLAGANVIMPNLSPVRVRAHYQLYDNKISTGEEAAEGLSRLQKRVEAVGYRIVSSRGDSPLCG